MLERLKECKLCGEHDYWSLFTVKKTVSIVKCKGCGLLYVNPRLVEKECREMYQPESYFKNKNVLLYGYDDYVKEEFLYRELFSRRLDALERFKPGGEILDVGCAAGFFLDVAQKRRWRTRGVELSAYASSYAREQFKLDVFTGMLDEAKFPPASFDVVVMDDVIEHVPDPLAVMREVHRILKPGGIYSLNTPNAGGWLRKVMRRKWFHFKEDHLFYFSHATMDRALRSAGFKPLQIKASGKVVTLRYLVGRMNHYSRRLARFLDWLIGDMAFANRPFYLYIGEMVVYAQK